jgi:anthranilate synthase component II
MKKTRKILIIDNYDSFTFNIAEQLRSLRAVTYKTIYNDKINSENIKSFDKILISPGPGTPSQIGQVKALIKEYAPVKSILGVCLGHQAIGETFGAMLKNLPNVLHGIREKVFIKNNNDYLFDQIDNSFEAGLYHSWIISKDNFPGSLEITAVTSNGGIMAISHRQYDIKGVQFHPESYLTPKGIKILSNWVFY